MTSLFGNPSERWPLSSAVDAMVASARRTGFPAWIWLMGLIYPRLTLSFGVIGPIFALLEASTGMQFSEVGGRINALLAEWNLDAFLVQPTVLPVLDGGQKAFGFLAVIFAIPVSLIIARSSVGLAQLSEESNWKRVASAIGFLP